MSPTIQTITNLHAQLMVDLFQAEPSTLSLSLILSNLRHLAKACEAYEGDTLDWCCVGECDHASVDNVLVGAYWALSHWHGGQDSETYATLCTIGDVLHPGMTDGPEPESAEADVYEALDSIFTQVHGKA